ncbi:hypothetical protein DdX_19969 [Ditylenchus destructor]|uniref:Uncharacterized protein n=1 Tax=Ditylenchus destructor TaxID=166010 RepID=A0AAD4MIL8_9BILA|nr:hypothetical protein DdX_19969 [Ditylenchus destructor]
MQSCNALQVQYFFFLLLLCTATISSAYISPFYFRTKPYMGTMDVMHRSPVVNQIQNESPKVESTETAEITTAAPVGITAARKDHPVRIMDLIIIPDAMGRYIGHMSSHANVMSRTNEQQNPGTEVESSTARPHRRKYDHNCFFTPVNCHPWIEPTQRM